MFTHEILVFTGHSEYHFSYEIIIIIIDKNRQETDLIYCHSPKGNHYAGSKNQ